jgi:hypothetical protein
MKQDNKLIDAIIDLSQEIKGLRKDMNRQLGELNGKVGQLNIKVEELNQRVGKLEKQQAITNLELKEMRLSYIKIDKRMEDAFQNHEKRINKLEHIVLK